ncbi:hypothetical protein AB0N93_03145 [Streptomyces sp. NPDC091267]|uniref:hypothetical protein n=1 Tax=unclassified Streptomyces TaxID=2593676 RepID=UPI00343E0255
MRPGLVRGLALGWVVPAAAGWGVTQWLGEPGPTSGPGPVAPASPAAEPGPQPEGVYADVCDRAHAGSGATAAPPAPPVPSAVPDPTASGPADGKARLSVVACSKAVVRDGWRAADR